MAATAALLLFFLVPLQAQAAVEEHLFDPTLSLTGGCATDKYDGVVDPWCPGPPAPSAAFKNPNIAIDSVGDMYVSSHGNEGTPGRVDVFSPGGQFLTELDVPGARALAVDPKGNLYVHQFVVGGMKRVTLFRPTGTYDPEAGEISYEDPGEVIIENQGLAAPCSEHAAAFLVGLAVDPVTEHLFVSPGVGCVGEWSSAEEGPELLDSTIGKGILSVHSGFVAADAAHNRLYISDETSEGALIQVFELAAPHAQLGTIDGHSTANGGFLAPFGYDTIAVDETSGNLIVSEIVATPVVYEFGPGLGEDEELLETYKYAGFKGGATTPLQVAVDNADTSANHRSFFVPTGPEGGLHHTFAFRFSQECEPVVVSAAASGVTETEAVLNGTVDPCGLETSYRIEYTTQPSGFEGAIVAAGGTLPAGVAAVPVSASLTGLSPGTPYRFRVVAENALGSDEAEASFRTYAPPGLGGPCPNQALRVGPSAALPDCRAYELVTPADTGGRSPRGAGTGRYFPTLQASPDGSKASFRIEGGTIPGFDSPGSGDGDNYLARRGDGGWTTERAGPSGTEAPKASPGGFSPDQEHAFWGENNASAGGYFYDTHIRYPDGHSEPVGRGTLGVDHEVQARLIGPNGSHTIFNSQVNIGVQLEANAPPSGTVAIYDRTADEVTHVVSLLPGDVTPAEGENAEYVGASLDGAGVAFKFENSSMLYLRRNNEKTYEIGEGLTFAGVTEGGGRVFYLQAGDLFAYDTASEGVIRFTESGETTPVNISPDGSTAYFLSPDVLSAEANPNGDHAQLNGENLYISREGQIGFVATVEAEDVEEILGNTEETAGLGMWLESLSRPALETSRTTSDGSALLFESQAALAGYDPAGHKEVYRYDGETLSCLSCNPTETAATAGASLQTLPRVKEASPVLGLVDRMLNVSSDAERAFFQSDEPLVASDVDNRQDVYEWEAQGVGSCTRSGGCVYLISSPRSARDEHLFAVSESGDDVFFVSGDLLGDGDTDSTASIYDARVKGGFPETEPAEPCQGEGCRPPLNPPPLLPTPVTPSLGVSGNLSPGKDCPKGKRKVKRHGKARCVKKKRRHTHKRHHRTAPKRKGSK